MNVLKLCLNVFLSLAIYGCDNTTSQTSPKPLGNPITKSPTQTAITTSDPQINEKIDYEAFGKVLKAQQHLTCQQDIDCQITTSVCGAVKVVNKQYHHAYSQYNAMLEATVDCSAPTEQAKDFQAKCVKQRCEVLPK